MSKTLTENEKLPLLSCSGEPASEGDWRGSSCHDSSAATPVLFSSQQVSLKSSLLGVSYYGCRYPFLLIIA